MSKSEWEMIIARGIIQIKLNSASSRQSRVSRHACDYFVEYIERVRLESRYSDSPTRDEGGGGGKKVAWSAAREISRVEYK